jgi:hypothetical protein
MSPHTVKTLACLLVVLFCAGAATAAQTVATGNIEGQVTDATGAVLAGVAVLVSNLDTNVGRDLVTDNKGRYRAVALQPGHYEVTVSLAGFAARPVTNIEVLVGRTVPVDVKMQAASVAENLTVVGEAPAIDPRRTDVSDVIDQDQIEHLPVNGRRWDNFVMLGPAVTNDGNFGLVSYRGVSGLYNNNMVDGIDNNQAFFSEARGRTRAVYSISESAIREFQVGVSNMSAEFGRAAGGTVNAVTKSGTNSFTGEGFYFIRDKAFQAKDPFIAQSVWDQIGERRQQFGAGVGGPILKDNVFFFLDYDQQKRNFPPFVATSSASFYNLSCTAPAANCSTTTAFFHSLEVASPREANNKVGFGKIDWRISSANALSLSYNGNRWNSPNGVQSPTVLSVANSANGTDIVTVDFGVVTLNTVLGQQWLNELRGQIGRDYEEQTPNGTPPSTTVTGGIGFGMPNSLPRPAYPHEQRYEFVDNVTHFHGNHSIKFGADINYVREQLINLFQGGGVYAYSNLSNIAQDCPLGAVACLPNETGATTGRHYNTFTQAFDLNNLAGALFFSTTTQAYYVQDTWRANDRLLLNFGLRYDYQPLPQPGSVVTHGVTFAGNPAFAPTTAFPQDKRDWGPRLGATYDIGGRHDTVVRAGYGIFYGLTSNSAVANALTNNGAMQTTYLFTPSTAGAPQYPNTFSTVPGSVVKPDINYFSSDFRRPRIQSFDVTVDRHLVSDVTLSVSYLYSRGEYLPDFRDTNLNPTNSTVNYVLDGQVVGSFPFYRGSRPNPSFQRMIIDEPGVQSRYNALVLAVDKRMSKGLLVNANYTLSKSVDDGQNSTTFFGGNAAFDSLNYRNPSNTVDFPMVPSPADRRHRFVGSIVYQPAYLWGIGISGIVRLESGLPITETIASSLSSAVGAVITSSSNGTGGFNVAPWVGINTDRQPGVKTVDLRLEKEVRLTGRRRVQILWEVFNLFNTLNYATFSNTAFQLAGSTYDPFANVATVTVTRDPGYLVPRSASSYFWGPRDMQVGAKFLW